MNSIVDIKIERPMPSLLKMRAYMTVKNVAEYLQISERVAYSLIKNGEIKHMKIGQKIIRVHINDVDEFMKKVGIKSDLNQLIKFLCKSRGITSAFLIRLINPNHMFETLILQLMSCYSNKLDWCVS